MEVRDGAIIGQTALACGGGMRGNSSWAVADPAHLARAADPAVSRVYPNGPGAAPVQATGKAPFARNGGTVVLRGPDHGGGRRAADAHSAAGSSVPAACRILSGVFDLAAGDALFRSGAVGTLGAEPDSRAGRAVFSRQQAGGHRGFRAGGTGGPGCQRPWQGGTGAAHRLLSFAGSAENFLFADFNAAGTLESAGRPRRPGDASRDGGVSARTAVGFRHRGGADSPRADAGEDAGLAGVGPADGHDGADSLHWPLYRGRTGGAPGASGRAMAGGMDAGGNSSGTAIRRQSAFSAPDVRGNEAAPASGAAGGLRRGDGGRRPGDAAGPTRGGFPSGRPSRTAPIGKFRIFYEIFMDKPFSFAA